MKKLIYKILLAAGLSLLFALWTGKTVYSGEGHFSGFVPDDETGVIRYDHPDLDSLLLWGDEFTRGMTVDSAWNLVNFAKNYIGCRYVYATHGPHTFDCSGFTGFVYNSCYNINLTYSSRYQSTVGRPVEPGLENLQTGDLVFFGSRRNPAVLGHVGMLVESHPDEGYFTFIHASVNNGIEIQRSDMSYYKIRYHFARRILQDFVGTPESAL